MWQATRFVERSLSALSLDGSGESFGLSPTPSLTQASMVEKWLLTKTVALQEQFSSLMTLVMISVRMGALSELIVFCRPLK